MSTSAPTRVRSSARLTFWQSALLALMVLAAVAVATVLLAVSSNHSVKGAGVPRARVAPTALVSPAQLRAGSYVRDPITHAPLGVPAGAVTGSSHVVGGYWQRLR
jgi:hypothetical protein